MKNHILFALHLVTIILISITSTSHAQAQCKEGRKQSPINIDPSAISASSARSITFGGGHDRFGWDAQPDHGTWEALLEKNAPHLTIKTSTTARKYKLKKLHFHSPSEHTIAGKAFAMELHLVYVPVNGISDEKVAVAVLLDIGEENPTLKRFLGIVKDRQEHGKISTAAPMGDLPGMLNLSAGYYVYDGSLTTSPYGEGVTWFVLRRTATVSEAQVKAFGKLVGGTHRDPCPLNGRSVYLVK
jgi:carbonic anhydrase